jgi:hypothetical protein
VEGKGSQEAVDELGDEGVEGSDEDEELVEEYEEDERANDEETPGDRSETGAAPACICACVCARACMYFLCVRVFRSACV